MLNTLSKLKLELLNVNQIKKQIEKQDKQEAADGKPDHNNSSGGFLSFFDGNNDNENKIEDI